MNTPGYRVLIAEDEPKIARSIADKVRRMFPQLEVAGICENGREALQKLKSDQPDILITDIVMPICTGLELIESARGISESLVIIIVSGYDDFEFARSALRFNVKDYLMKPVSDDKLKALLENIIFDLRQRGATAREKMYFQYLHQFADLPPVPKNERTTISLFLVNIGNALSPFLFSSSETAAYYQLIQILAEEIRSATGGSVIFDISPNTFYTLIDDPTMDSSSRFAAACRIESILISHEPEFPVQGYLFLYTDSSLNLGTLPAAAKALQRELESSKRPWSRHLWSLSKPNQREDWQQPAPKENSFDSYLFVKETAGILSALILQGSLYHARTDFIDSISVVLSKNITQGDVETVIIRTFRDLQQELGSSDDQAELVNPELPIKKLVQLSPDKDAFLAGIGDLFSNFFCRYAKADSRELIHSLAGYLEEHLSHPLTLEMLSDRTGFESSYIIRLFRRHIGTTPMKYVRDLRMDLARKLLIHNPELDIFKIGNMVGYDDQHYFSRIFRNTTGCTPSQYRRNHTEAADSSN